MTQTQTRASRLGIVPDPCHGGVAHRRRDAGRGPEPSRAAARSWSASRATSARCSPGRPPSSRPSRCWATSTAPSPSSTRTSTSCPVSPRRWDVSEDGLTVTLHLRDGVTFHSGAAAHLGRRQGVARRDQGRGERRGRARQPRFGHGRRRARRADRRAHPVGPRRGPPLRSRQRQRGHPAGRRHRGAVLAHARGVRRVRAPSDAQPHRGDPDGAPGRHRRLQVRQPDAQRVHQPRPQRCLLGRPAPLDGVEFRVIPDEASIVAGIQAGNINLAVLNDPLVAQQAETDGIPVVDDPAAGLPRAPAERPRGAARQPQRASRHPVRHRPPGGPRHRRPRRGRDHRSHHVARLQERPECPALPDA